MNPSSDFILLSFFHRLRKSAGMELDMTQYYLFLELFMKGYARDKAALLTLCKTLWLTQAKFRENFETWFEEAFKEMNDRLLPEMPIPSAKEKKPPPPKMENDAGYDEKEVATEDPDNVQKNKPPTSETRKDEKTEQAGTSADLLDVMLNFEEGTDKTAPLGKKTRNKASEKDTEFIFSDEKHLPVMPRRLGLAMQRLRLASTFRPGDQLDLPAVVRQIGKEGFITRLDYRQVSGRCQDVLFLTDHEGSMSAFETWGDFLYHSFSRHSTIDRLSRYYFHDHPTAVKNNFGTDTFKLFSNTSHTTSVLAEQVLTKASDKSTWLVIFSDAGAYEPAPDSETLKHWLRFLKMAQQQVAAVTWINPLPQRRWESSMADYLSFFVKMVPFDLEGMRQAIKCANNANRNRTS